MYEDLKAKSAIVTGSGKRSGIGFAIAEMLASCGANVIIADLGTMPFKDVQVRTGSWSEMCSIAEDLSDRFGVRSFAVNLDVTKNDSIRKMLERIKADFDGIDVLVNNAGASFGVPSAVHDYDEDAWMRTIDVNLHGVFRVSRAVIPLMLSRGGTIINTASRAGKVPPLFNGAYAVAKAGVIMLTKVMARELAANNIRINAICPGQIETDLEQWRFGLEAQFYGSSIEEREREMCKTIPLARLGSPHEVAALAVFLASSASSYLTGQAINVTGGQLMEL